MATIRLLQAERDAAHAQRAQAVQREGDGLLDALLQEVTGTVERIRPVPLSPPATSLVPQRPLPE